MSKARKKTNRLMLSNVFFAESVLSYNMYSLCQLDIVDVTDVSIL